MFPEQKAPHVRSSPPLLFSTLTSSLLLYFLCSVKTRERPRKGNERSSRFPPSLTLNDIDSVRETPGSPYNRLLTSGLNSRHPLPLYPSHPLTLPPSTPPTRPFFCSLYFPCRPRPPFLPLIGLSSSLKCPSHFLMCSSSLL